MQLFKGEDAAATLAPPPLPTLCRTPTLPAALTSPSNIPWLQHSGH